MDTVVVGLDGGEWDVIDPLIRAGELPTIAALKAAGISGPLESIVPPISPPAWNSIQTGTNPGKHGIFDFSTFDADYQRRSINATDRHATPFWTVLNDHDVSTGLFKVPFTYPPDDVDGFMVTGFPTPNTVRDHATPESIRDRVGPPKPLFEDWAYQNRGEYEQFKRNLIAVAEHQTDVLLELVDTHETDFLMTVYDGTDRIQHFFWKYFDEAHPRYDSDSPLCDAIPAYYRTIDDSIRRILDAAGEVNVLLLSDHGFGPLAYDIYIDEWLESNGYLTRRGGRAPRELVTSTAATTVQTMWDLVRRLHLDGAVETILPASWFERGFQLQDASDRSAVWEETTAFFSTLSGQAIYVNVADRFAAGTVAESDYEHVVETLRSELLALRSPETGQRLIEDVVRSDEAFDGWMVDAAPDLIVRSAPQYTLRTGRSDRLVRPATQNANERSGDHRSDGIFLASGPAFGSGQLDTASILDVAPTLLYLHRCPIPAVVDGSVLQSIFTPDARTTRRIERTSSYGRESQRTRTWTDEEAAELDDRLGSMGYL